MKMRITMVGRPLSRVLGFEEVVVGVEVVMPKTRMAKEELGVGVSYYDTRWTPHVDMGRVED
jgi:hypothetical protein